ncbi:MAG: PEP-CTERM sorting domain-containing protein [Myxococcota bacterium]|jgi:hypothetical protein|nr:PEP-CTERM sorting domain-containing protein [Myxococcota bacterium]
MKLVPHYATHVVATFTFIALLSIFGSGQAAAAPFDFGCGSADDIDTNPATIVGCNVTETGTISDLNVYLNIDDFSATDDPYATDLQLSLVHVASMTTVRLYVGPEIWNPRSMMDATFDDDTGARVPGSGNIIGTFLAADNLSAFNGLELSGAWKLHVLDDWTFPNEGIDLIDWRLQGTHVPEPGTGVLLAVGLALLSNRKPPAAPQGISTAG